MPDGDFCVEGSFPSVSDFPQHLHDLIKQGDMDGLRALLSRLLPTAPAACAREGGGGDDADGFFIAAIPPPPPPPLSHDNNNDASDTFRTEPRRHAGESQEGSGVVEDANCDSILMLTRALAEAILGSMFDGSTVFHLAVRAKQPLVIPLLAAAVEGAIVTLFSASSNTPRAAGIEGERNLLSASVVGQRCLGDLSLNCRVDSLPTLACLLNAHDRCGLAPLHHAVVEDCADMCAALLAVGAHRGVGDSYAATPLHYAVTDDRPHLIPLLLGASDGIAADTDDNDEGMGKRIRFVDAVNAYRKSALHIAIEERNMAAVEALITVGEASVGYGDGYGDGADEGEGEGGHACASFRTAMSPIRTAVLGARRRLHRWGHDDDDEDEDDADGDAAAVGVLILERLLRHLQGGGGRGGPTTTATTRFAEHCGGGSPSAHSDAKGRCDDDASATAMATMLQGGEEEEKEEEEGDGDGGEYDEEGDRRAGMAYIRRHSLMDAMQTDGTFPQVIDALLACGADPNAVVEGCTALYCAVAHNQPRRVVAPLLLAAGSVAAWRAAGSDGGEQHITASSRGVIDLPFAAESRVGLPLLRTPLHAACGADRCTTVGPSLARLLLQHGASVSSLTVPAFEYECDYDEGVDGSLETNCYHDGFAEDHHLTALHCAAAGGGVAKVELLLSHGADVEARSLRCGMTAFHCAARNGCVATVRALLAAGADPTAADGVGWTPMRHAQCRLRSRHGSDEDADDDEKIAVISAAVALWK